MAPHAACHNLDAWREIKWYELSSTHKHFSVPTFHDFSVFPMIFFGERVVKLYFYWFKVEHIAAIKFANVCIWRLSVNTKKNNNSARYVYDWSESCEWSGKVEPSWEKQEEKWINFSSCVIKPSWWWWCDFAAVHNNWAILLFDSTMKLFFFGHFTAVMLTCWPCCWEWEKLLFGNSLNHNQRDVSRRREDSSTQIAERDDCCKINICEIVLV